MEKKREIQFVGFWERFCASLIDTVILIVLLVSIFYAIYGIDFIEKSSSLNTINILVNYILPFILVIGLWKYTGATPGKTFFQIKIVDATTLENPTIKQFIIRYLAYIVSFIPLGLGFLWVLWDKKKQAWHDKLAHTVLIEPKTEPKKISFLGYVGRIVGSFLLIAFLLFMIISAMLGFAIQEGYAPDQNLYSLDRLNSKTLKELVDKDIIKNKEALLYLNPSSLYSFTDEGMAITKYGIVKYEEGKNGKSQKEIFYFKDIDTLDLENIDDSFLDISIYDKDVNLLFYEYMSLGNQSAKELKKELYQLWQQEKIFSLSSYDVSGLDQNISTYITQIKSTKNKDDLIGIIGNGYYKYMDNPKDFSMYNSEVLKLINNNSWKDKSMSMNSHLWMDALLKNQMDEESLDTFFEQMKTLDALERDENTTWGVLSKKLPSIYLYFMDKQLQHIIDSNVSVPQIELYQIDGTTIDDMNASRHYFVSDIYKRISEFCDDAKNISCSAEDYAKKAVESSSINPNALFRYAYELDNDTESIKLLENILLLTKKSDNVLDINQDAVYNNLGYAIYNSGKTKKYDDALKYLQKAYELDSESVYSLTTMSGIYRERKEYQSAYNIMEKEAYTFFHTSDEALNEKETNYWLFVRGLISTAYELRDYNTTKYVCNRYFKLRDAEYEECHECLKEIDALSQQEKSKPLHSFWKLYTEPELFVSQIDKKSKGVLECGSVMTYADSLKYKSTSRQQTHLLEKFTQLYRPFKVPETLKSLINIEEKLGADSYTVSFYLDPEERSEFFKSMFDYDDEKRNAKVAQHFLPLAHLDGTGAMAAFWLKDGNETDLENAPIIEFGSEGHIGVVAKNIKDFIYMLSFGVEPMDGDYSQFVTASEEYYRREGFEAYREWLKTTMHIEPVKEWKIWGTPEKVETLQIEAKQLYQDTFFQWLYTKIPDNSMVQKAKQEADTFAILKQEKKRLEHLLENNEMGTTYMSLAKNAQKLRDINRAERDDVVQYYKKAFSIDTNESIITQWALFLSRFDNEKSIKSKEDRAYFYANMQDVYQELNQTKQVKKYMQLAITQYAQCLETEKDMKKKTKLYEKVADLYKESNISKAAIDYYKKAIEYCPEEKAWYKEYFYIDIAELNESSKKYSEAVKYYKNALEFIEKKKDKAKYQYLIANNYKHLGNYKEALTYARKAFVNVPKNTLLREKSKKFIEELKTQL